MNSFPNGQPQKKTPTSVYLAATVVIFFLSLSAADSIGFVPCTIDATCADTSADSIALSSLPQLGIGDASSTASSVNVGVLPTHISIPAVGIDLPVQNPTTTDVDALDALLKNGPARYPDSAKLGAEGNVLIFAHTSHLPIVHNPMFQAFNNIPNLKSGDTISLTGEDGKQYLYSVDSVVRADTSDGTTIDLTTDGGKKLTLVTCDTLTGKSARFILTADFVGVVGN
jgi:LPXTG-site transpeptidase (sortase) family protein